MPFPYTFPFRFDLVITVTEGIPTVEGLGRPVVGEKLIFPSSVTSVEGLGEPVVVHIAVPVAPSGYVKTMVSCDGLMARLGEEIIATYDTGTDGSPVGEIVTALLAFQRKATQVGEGTVGATGTRAISITNKSILSSLIQLQESVGGYISVDNDWDFQWPTTIGEDKKQEIRYRKNLRGIIRDIDYENFCTKLHPESSDESLSDISIGPVDVDTDTDASYGYITLAETYAAYKDWKAAGNPLPDNVTVFKQNVAAVWKVSTGVDSATGWTDSAKVIDDDWGTYGYSNEIDGPEVWTNYITCSIESGFYGTVKFKGSYTSSESNYFQKIEISAYDGADWTVIYYGYGGLHGETTAGFAGQTVEKFRVRARSGAGFYAGNTGSFYLYECQFLQSDLADDSAVWEQGEFENTIRCDIGDWDAGATYQISYTYADYLVAWDQITTADDIVSRVVVNKYESYSLSLLEAAILLLDELKVIPITYDIDTIDLSQNEDFDFSFDALELGSQVRVIDEDMGVNVNVRIIRMEHPDLLEPERMKLQLSTRVKDISDYIANLHREFS